MARSRFLLLLYSAFFEIGLVIPLKDHFNFWENGGSQLIYLLQFVK